MHEIKAMAQDAAGNMASATIQVEVVAASKSGGGKGNRK
jgi:hypothetical protein